MHTNYLRLGGEAMLDQMAQISEMQSVADYYQFVITEAESAHRFGKGAEDDDAGAEIKEQLLFEMAVLAPCVIVQKASPPKQFSQVVLEFNDRRLYTQNQRVAEMCRDVDSRHECLQRFVTSLVLEKQQAGIQITETLYGTLVLEAQARTGRVIAQTQVCLDNNDWNVYDLGSLKRMKWSGAVSIDRLERTLFMFRLLVGNARLTDKDERKVIANRCALYGFDDKMFAYAAHMFMGDALSEDQAREQFIAAKPAVLYDERVAAIVRGAEYDEVQQVKKRSASVIVIEKAGGSTKKRAKKKDVNAIPVADVNKLDAWLSKIQRPKGGAV
jgi:hypothetical protein